MMTPRKLQISRQMLKSAEDDLIPPRACSGSRDVEFVERVSRFFWAFMFCKEIDLKE